MPRKEKAAAAKKAAPVPAPVVPKAKGKPSKEKAAKKKPPPSPAVRTVAVAAATKPNSPAAKKAAKASKTAAPAIIVPVKGSNKRTAEVAFTPHKEKKPPVVARSSKDGAAERTVEVAFTPHKEKKAVLARSIDGAEEQGWATARKKLLILLEDAQNKQQDLIKFMAEREDELRVAAEAREEGLRRRIESAEKHDEQEIATLIAHYKAVDELRQKDFRAEKERREQTNLRLVQELREKMCGTADIEGQLVAYRALEGALQGDDASSVNGPPDAQFAYRGA